MARPALVKKSHRITRILLVEDNPSDAFLVRTMFDEIPGGDYDILHVSTHAEALLAMHRQSFDACLLDLTLPDVSGFSALIDLQEKNPELPVMILTGHNDTELAKQAVGRGAQDYLLKDQIEVGMLGRCVDYAIERKRTEKTLFERANHDALTGLANRSMFESRLAVTLARARREGSGIAVLFIDLDRFKPINDSYGHEAGDDVLKVIGQRLKHTVRAYDTPARFGGDEFAVLLEGVTSSRDAAAIAQKIISTIGLPIPYHGKYLEICASVGIALADAAISAHGLLQHADVAMYYAKKDGGNAYCFYAPAMQGAAQAHLKLEDDLRSALAAEEFKLYYQPYISPGSAAVLGVEALLRWANPEHGLQNPGDFLAAAEAGQMMPEISAWIGAQLKRDIAMWNEEAMPPLEIAVNISAAQLDAPNAFDWLTPLADPAFLGDHRLVVEVPEEVMASMSDTRFARLTHLSELGIAIHLDHFGTGVLSLQTLHSLPFSLLKIDRSLIQNMSDEVSGDVLIRAAILLAHNLGIKAGAIGVETPWQKQRLESQQCDVLQGFLTARPMTAEEFVEWMANPQPSLAAGQVI